ncbi:Golgi apparatus membrane protein tvp23 [Ceratobasidium sp. 394]|nr:Golgi apparatus membrane protein tvp23 [Ceratobasidium sp. 394]
MSTTDPLLTTIEPDEVGPTNHAVPDTQRPSAQREQVVLTPTNRAQQSASSSELEAGLAGIWKQSSHPMVLFVLYLLRIAAITVYILCGFFTDNYVLSTVIVVVLLAMDFWNCRNVAGRRLVGLRFWNQVDEDGESYWVFESRDPSRPANPIDSKFLPIVGLALVFNITNVIGFTYADRDAKHRWASSVAAGGWNMGMGGLGGQILGSAVRNSVGRVFGL